jgi:hypothetical protein
MDSVHLLLQSSTIALAAVWWVPALLRNRPRGYKRYLGLLFVWFFGLGMYFLPDRHGWLEAIFRSVGTALIPFAAGWLMLRFSKR